MIPGRGQERPGQLAHRDGIDLLSLAPGDDDLLDIRQGQLDMAPDEVSDDLISGLLQEVDGMLSPFKPRCDFVDRLGTSRTTASAPSPPPTLEEQVAVPAAYKAPQYSLKEERSRLKRQAMASLAEADPLDVGSTLPSYAKAVDNLELPSPSTCPADHRPGAEGSENEEDCEGVPHFSWRHEDVNRHRPCRGADENGDIYEADIYDGYTDDLTENDDASDSDDGQVFGNRTLDSHRNERPGMQEDCGSWNQSPEAASDHAAAAHSAGGGSLWQNLKLDSAVSLYAPAMDSEEDMTPPSSLSPEGRAWFQKAQQTLHRQRLLQRMQGGVASSSVGGAASSLASSAFGSGFGASCSSARSGALLNQQHSAASLRDELAEPVSVADIDPPPAHEQSSTFSLMPRGDPIGLHGMRSQSSSSQSSATDLVFQLANPQAMVGPSPGRLQPRGYPSSSASQASLGPSPMSSTISPAHSMAGSAAHQRSVSSMQSASSAQPRLRRLEMVRAEMSSQKVAEYQQTEEDRAGEPSFRPSITSTARRMSRSHVAGPPPAPTKSIMAQRKEAWLAEKRAKEAETCTFKPKMYTNAEQRRKSDAAPEKSTYKAKRLEQWAAERRQEEENACTFQPKIDKRSKDLAVQQRRMSDCSGKDEVFARLSIAKSGKKDGEIAVVAEQEPDNTNKDVRRRAPAAAKKAVAKPAAEKPPRASQLAGKGAAGGTVPRDITAAAAKKLAMAGLLKGQAAQPHSVQSKKPPAPRNVVPVAAASMKSIVNLVVAASAADGGGVEPEPLHLHQHRQEPRQKQEQQDEHRQEQQQQQHNQEGQAAAQQLEDPQPQIQQPAFQQPEVQQSEVQQPEVQQPEVQQPEVQQPEVLPQVHQVSAEQLEDQQLEPAGNAENQEPASPSPIVPETAPQESPAQAEATGAQEQEDADTQPKTAAPTSPTSPGTASMLDDDGLFMQDSVEEL
eukprot:TRINITY_DN4671_c0_g1_i1.p1 TRINITY_DN4671_c0_g1~~TRINITY_DN4671_c0_g1_i1.p1  ORF type:complete len:958 (+),score=229.20 TRINITY_DN4671_c0_g1_i1:179-3052(+)